LHGSKGTNSNKCDNNELTTEYHYYLKPIALPTSTSQPAGPGLRFLTPTVTVGTSFKSPYSPNNDYSYPFVALYENVCSLWNELLTAEGNLSLGGMGQLFRTLRALAETAATKHTFNVCGRPFTFSKATIAKSTFLTSNAGWDSVIHQSPAIFKYIASRLRNPHNNWPKIEEDDFKAVKVMADYMNLLPGTNKIRESSSHIR